jgi:hypothetical protein
MMNLNEELKKLYQDAAYYYLLRHGCSAEEAKGKVKNLFDTDN